MKKKPRVDVLLATCNGEKHIAEQLDSLLAQSHPPSQILIRDDGSNDRTRSILENYANRYPAIIQVALNSRADGIVANFSMLLSLTRADYIFFCDQDDVWKKDKIETSLAAMQQVELDSPPNTPLLLHTDLEVVNTQLLPIDRSLWRFNQLNPLKTSTFNRLLVQNTITGCTVLINRALQLRLGAIPKGALMHDWWMGLTAAAFGKIITLNKTTMLYRQHGSNAIGAKKMSLFSYIKRGIQQLVQPKKIAEDIQKRYDQAEAFNTYYGTVLPEDKQRIIQAFLAAPQASWLTKRYLMMRYGFIRNGALRNLSRFFLRNPF